MANIDGICEECGNTGLVGEICSFCGSRIEPIDKGIEQFENDEVIPVVKKSKSAASQNRRGDMFDDDDDLEDINLEDEMEDIEDDDSGSNNLSIDDLAEKENDKEDKEAWFDPDNFNIDD